MGPLKELSRVQYMSYANVHKGEHHLPHTPLSSSLIAMSSASFWFTNGFSLAFNGEYTNGSHHVF